MRCVWSLIFVCLVFPGLSQSWQQKVDYTIQCRLDDQSHRLEATMQIVYHNHSPNELNILKLHTWMNTFKTSGTPYSNQLISLGSDRRHTLKRNEEGGYSNLNFSRNGKAISYQFTDASGEILDLKLNETCKPGEVITIDVRFTLQLPKNISRGGHLGQSYQCTQWYPKLALYDEEGWHEMHYLEFGEYYNEFGDYEVAIELPANYIVASTGELQNEEEKKFLIQYADSCKSHSNQFTSISKINIPSSPEYKKLKYIAKQVIDFAWFADKRFMVNYHKLPWNERSIELWSFYYPLNKIAWSQSLNYTSKAINYFSEWVGPYPYPQVSLVECPRYGTDAMEYPMITLIDQYYGQPLALERVIVHEVGHNWFQSILATDERQNAWMDEGLVTYYEHRYFRGKSTGGLFSDTPFPLHTDYNKVTDFDWYIQAHRNQDKNSIEAADRYSVREYIQSIYEKPAKGLNLMESQLGTEIFDKMIRTYFSQWKFHHPKPKNLFSIFKNHQVTWYDSLYLSTATKIDFSIAPAGSCYFIKHAQDYIVPVELAGYKKNIKVYSQVIPIDKTGDTICIEADTLDYLLLDPEFYLPEVNRTNNILRIRRSPYTPKTFALRFLGGIDHSLVKEMYITPALSYNFYDGLMVGLSLHNLSLPTKPFRYAGMFGYGLRSKRPVWLAGADYTLPLRSSKFESLNFNIESRQYTFNRDTHYLFDNHYQKWAPGVKLNFRRGRSISTWRQLGYRWIQIDQNYGVGINFANKTYSRKSRSYGIHEFRYLSQNTRSLFPHEFNITGELGNKYSKLTTTYSFALPYTSGNKKQVEFYFFGGVQSLKPSSKVFSTFLLNGQPGIDYFQRDYKMDELLFGRSEQSGSLSNQIFIKDAAFRNITNVGSSQSWMLAGSIRSTLPGIIPLRPYIQAALSPIPKGSVAFFYTSGVSLVLIPKIFEVNFPAWESSSITSGSVYQERKSYLKRCTFMFNMKLFNPMKWLDRVAQ